MIQFNFKKFLFDNRLSISDLSRQIKTSQPAISRMVERGSVKPSFLKRLEKLYSCEKFINGA